MTTTLPDSRALVDAAQAGDRAAFGALYERYHDVVFRFVDRRVNSHQLAEDITAETFVRALRNLSQFTWRQDIGAWLVTIARNIVTDHYKSGRYRMEAPTAGAVFEIGIDHDRRRDPVDVAEMGELSAALDAAVRQLTDDQRQVIALRFGAGLNCAETAEWLGCNVGAVKSMQTRAVRTLRRILQEVPR